MVSHNKEPNVWDKRKSKFWEKSKKIWDKLKLWETNSHYGSQVAAANMIYPVQFAMRTTFNMA